ncbi:DPP IV N-terminal domain-containing protein [Nonomuraea typhae]|uniref:DPP IV N-terminal domain-containing protein n=1 Tax=Nonomuraea typhae TaxID=2603600 RepID=A0ABW7Z0V2_9ACTN
MSLSDTRYKNAEKLLGHNRHKIVFGAKVRPNWLEGGARFWYKSDTATRRQFLVVDPEAGTRRPAFDHERLAKALEAASGHEVSAIKLPFFFIALTGEAVYFAAFAKNWQVSLDTYEVTETPAPPAVDPIEAVSPDGQHTVFRDGPNLGLRRIADNQTRTLTDDGDADHEYGVNPDYFQYDNWVKVVGLSENPICAIWSPDGAKVVTHRSDQSGIGKAWLIEDWPRDGSRPKLYPQRLALPGDEHIPLAEIAVVDVQSGQVVKAQAEPELMTVVSPILLQWVWWAEDSSAVYYLSQPRDLRTLSLRRMDPLTGEVTTLVSESGPTRVDPNQVRINLYPLVRVINGGSEVLWYSQRDGWGHFYLYDAKTGELRNQVTSGRWTVQEILHVDEASRTVYFLANGLIGEDPYRRSVCKADLDGGGFTRITDDSFDHAVSVSADGRFFVDSASTTGTPPITTVRSWDGEVRVELERADISLMEATGWSAPERFRAKAADGVTDVYGLLYKPHDFDPDKCYPIIDSVYPGPQVPRVVPTFDPGGFGYEGEAFAALGFVVVAMDGRGTPGRDKAFHDHSYLNYRSAGAMEDHVAAITELARTRPWMDINKVGITGISGGGYQTARAMLDHPEFFKVGVSRSGNHDSMTYLQGWAEMFDGPVGEVDYSLSSNAEHAHRLQGKLLLIAGGIDTKVLPEQTLRFVDRLIEHDKDFELLIIPGTEHLYLGFEHYSFRKIFDYFVRNLLDEEPPSYRLARAAWDPETLAEWFV